MPRERHTNPKPLYESLDSAAKRIGFSVGYLRELIKEGRLVAYRISDKPGAAIRVKVAAVNALMKPVPISQAMTTLAATYPSAVYANEIDTHNTTPMPN